jgi:CRISPR-associated exonuclease Cas4
MENIKSEITTSIMLEYLYCPRFIYFMEVLKIDQYEDKRRKVQKGRDIHKYKALTNQDYKRKKIGVTKKLTEMDLYSEQYGIHGKVDEILFLENETASPLDYKFAEYKGKIYKTLKMQTVFYGLLIKENYNKNVNKAYIVYTRSKNHLVEIDIKGKDFENLLKIINDIRNIIDLNFYPKKTKYTSKCNDCCYRNICEK